MIMMMDAQHATLNKAKPISNGGLPSKDAVDCNKESVHWLMQH